MIISMMGVMSRFSSTSSSTKMPTAGSTCCRVEYRSIRVTSGYVKDTFSVPCYTLSEYKDLHSFEV